jgi:hypothetical protein
MWVLALLFIKLTGPNGEEVDVNPAEIVSLRVEFDEKGNFHSMVNCIVRSVDGNFIGVRETCEKVRRLIDSPDVPMPRQRPAE